MRSISTSCLDRLRAALGPDGVLTAPADVAPYLTEMRGLVRGEADAVLRPRSSADISAILRIAGEEDVPIAVQGGNTGLVGGGVPFGGLVVSLARLNAIRAVDPINSTLLAEAGVVLKTVQEAADAVDRLFPLSLGSEGSCTIGGNIASNAGGTAVLRYGNMRDLVLGLEVVLPDGRIFNGLSGLRKDNAGFDLKQLFIGSEGTLGIITAANLKLFPRPKSRLAGFAGAASPDCVVALFSRLRALAGERLTTFEILPRFGLQIVLKHRPATRDPLAEPYPWYAFFEMTAPEPEAGLEALALRALEAAMAEGEIDDATLAANLTQGEAFWAIRDHLSECQRYEGGSIKHDVSVPISRVAQFIRAASEACLQAMPGLRLCPFGHIGDGNIHFNLSQPIGADREAFLSQWHRFNLIVHDEVARHGGSIAAEHGVGLFKRDELPRYKDKVALDLMVQLKRMLDPNNLLNPGKVIALDAQAPVFAPGKAP